MSEILIGVLYLAVGGAMSALALMRWRQQRLPLTLLSGMWALFALRIGVRWLEAGGVHLFGLTQLSASDGAVAMNALLLLVAIGLVWWEER